MMMPILFSVDYVHGIWVVYDMLLFFEPVYINLYVIIYSNPYIFITSMFNLK